MSNPITLPNFVMKHINADFLVDEIYLEPRLTPLDEASHTYLYVRKENLTTFQLLQIMADYFKLDVRNVEASGLKDEQAITCQIISIQAVISEAQVRLVNDFFKDKGVNISIQHLIGYGQQPVYPRKLHGNKFTVTLRNLEADVAQQVEAYLKANKFFSLINYYDEQRFGLPDAIHNTHHIGQHLLANEWQAAYQAYLKSSNEAAEMARVKATFAQSQSHLKALQTIMPAKMNFFVSSYNSFLWNQSLNKNIMALKESVQVDLPYLGQITLPRSNQTPLPTIHIITVEKKNWQSGENFQTVKQRPVVLNIPVYLLDKREDALFSNHKQALTIAFYLPTGCYATMLVKQLLVNEQVIKG